MKLFSTLHTTRRKEDSSTAKRSCGHGHGPWPFWATNLDNFMLWAASDFLFPAGFSCNIQNSWGQEGSWRMGSWRPWLCSWDFVICPCAATTIGPHVHTNFSWLLDVPPHICTSVCVQKTRSPGRIRSWLAILFSAEVQDQTSRPRITHQPYFHPTLG